MGRDQGCQCNGSRQVNNHWLNWINPRIALDIAYRLATAGLDDKQLEIYDDYLMAPIIETEDMRQAKKLERKIANSLAMNRN